VAVSTRSREPKLDRLARSAPDARSILDELTARGVTLALGQSYDPADDILAQLKTN
jgi:DNA invertase Pin-like site-specific DNA recombinase